MYDPVSDVTITISKLFLISGAGQSEIRSDTKQTSIKHIYWFLFMSANLKTSLYYMLGGSQPFNRCLCCNLDRSNPKQF